MNTAKLSIVAGIDTALGMFAINVIPLPGLTSPVVSHVLAAQIMESVRRVSFIGHAGTRPIASDRANPRSQMFDPIKAALLSNKQNQYEEACWFVFLAVHFGQHRRRKWQLAREVYAGPAAGHEWTWSAVSKNPQKFKAWVSQQPLVNAFGNHRKYETTKRIGVVVESYVKWVGVAGGHHELFQAALATNKNDPMLAFDDLFRATRANVKQFARTGAFDYLTMISRVGLAQIRPGKIYLSQATGPKNGARLLFGGSKNAKVGSNILERSVAMLGAHLGVDLQVLEDALCNWQKSTSIFVPYRG
jgi:hypothetical protein